MDEKPDQIMNHIETQREQLGRNLNELETRVKGATDWRQQFDRNPMLMMGVALGGGLLLGTIVGGGSKKSSSRSNWSSSSRSYGGAAMGVSSAGSYGASSGSSGSSSSSSSPAVREQRKKATDTLEHMKAALIGFATAKVKEFMSEALPGFNQHLDEAERRNTGGQQDSMHRGSGSEQGSSHGQSSGQSSGQQNSGYQSGGSAPGQASTRTEHSSNSPYTQQQPVGANPGLNI